MAARRSCQCKHARARVWLRERAATHARTHARTESALLQGFPGDPYCAYSAGSLQPSYEQARTHAHAAARDLSHLCMV